MLSMFCAASAQEQITIPDGATPEVLSAYNAGSQMLNSGRANEAVEKFRIVTKALPNFGHGHSGLGAALTKVGKNAEAVEELKKASSLLPKDQQSLVFLGQAYQLSGRSAEALETYKKYLSLFPQGQYAQQVNMMLKTLEFEVARMKGVSSKGQDNYLNEAMAPGGGKWMNMPVKVFIASGDGVEDYKPEYVDILKNAFKEWADASGGKLSFAYVDNQKDSGINCRWSANPKDLMNPQEGGQALAARDLQGRIIKVEMLILTKNPLMPVAFTDKYVKHVCLHEIGHSLGLAGHSSQPGDIMFAAANFEAASGVISDRDKKTISALYANAVSSPAKQ